MLKAYKINSVLFACAPMVFDMFCCLVLARSLKVVTNEKIRGSGVTSTLGTWYGGVLMGVLCPLMGPPSCIEISTVRCHKSKI